MTKSSIRYILCTLYVALAAGCSRDTSEVTQSEWEKLIAIRGEVREVYRRQMVRRFERCAEQETARNGGESSDVGSTPHDLFSDGNIRLLQKIEDSYAADSEDERKVRRLRHSLISLRLAAETESVALYLSEMQRSSKVDFDGRLIGLGALQAILSESSDRDRRQQAYVVRVPQLQKESAVIQERIRIEDSTAVMLGYGDYTSLMQEEQQIDFASLNEQTASFISATDSLYSALAETAVPQLIGLRAQMLREYDLPFLTQSSPFDELFECGALVARLPDILIKMGLVLDPARIGRMICESRNAFERPATIPISIPDDIRVVIPGGRGLSKVSCLMHEIGHALHLINTAEREFEFTQLGEGGLKEAYAFLIEGLLDEPEFARAQFNIPEAGVADYLRQRAYVQLLTVRSCCGDFQFEQAVFAGSQDLRDVYESIKRPIAKTAWNDIDGEMLFQRVDHYEAAEYLTGWFLAAQIREHLRQKFGAKWYESADAGEFLKGLWQHGTRKTALEVAAQLGDSAITPQALIAHFARAATL